MTTEHLIWLSVGAVLNDSSAGNRRTQRMCQSVENVQIKNSPAVPLKIRVTHME